MYLILICIFDTFLNVFDTYLIQDLNVFDTNLYLIQDLNVFDTNLYLIHS